MGACWRSHDAAALWEVENLGQALGTTFGDTNRSAPAWILGASLARVWSGTPGSCECELIEAAGGQRTVVFSGISLPDHRDGIPSCW